MLRPTGQIPVLLMPTYDALCPSAMFYSRLRSRNKINKKQARAEQGHTQSLSYNLNFIRVTIRSYARPVST